MDSLIEDEYDGDDMPTIECNREKPELSVGTIFQSMWTVGMQSQHGALYLKTPIRLKGVSQQGSQFFVHILGVGGSCMHLV